MPQIVPCTCIYDWHHVPSAMNPADLASRGCTAKVLASNEIWLNGPKFLKRPPNKWPQLPILGEPNNGLYSTKRLI